jgi:hypothetical protein
MSKKYLSLDEAASMLGMPREELTRLREKGELRGFADRGTWKFKVEDIENLARSRQADSDPEVPMILDESESGDAIVVEDDATDFFAQQSDAPEDSSMDRDLLSNSDSDVRLILDDELADAVKEDMAESDSDVKLIGDADSDSDVKIADDATVREMPMPVLEDSDSDVKLAMPADQPIALDRSDSDVQLLPDNSDLGQASDSDVAILRSDSGVSLDFGDAARQESVLPDDIDLGPTSSGILSGGSGVGLRPNDSGIALSDDDDEGITLAPASSGPGSGITLGEDSGISLSAADSGISLSAADSGISLEAVADSGISLEDSRDHMGTVPMMNAIGDDDDDVARTTKFEMPQMADEDSAFDLQTTKGKRKPGKPDTEETGVLDISDDEGSLDDAVFDVDDEAAEDESAADLDVSDDLVADDEEVEELDVFDADEAFEGEADEDMADAPMARRAAAAEPEWGTGMNIAAGLAALFTVACTLISFDLVKSMWLWGDRPVEPGFFLGLVSKLF